MKKLALLILLLSPKAFAMQTLVYNDLQEEQGYGHFVYRSSFTAYNSPQDFDEEYYFIRGQKPPKRPKTFMQQVKSDTEEVFGKNFKAQVIFDYVSGTPRYGVATTVWAWRFLGLDPALTYAPTDANRKVEFEIVLPIRIKRIPLGHGLEVKDFLDQFLVGGWWDNLWYEPYLAQNLSTGHFSAGLAFGFHYR